MSGLKKPGIRKVRLNSDAPSTAKEDTSTTGAKPTGVRFSPLEKKRLEDLVETLSKQSNKQIKLSTIVRALTYLLDGPDSEAKVLNIIKENL